MPETEVAWLERAEALSCAELESEVATSEVGRPPRRDRLGLPRVRLDVRLRLSPVAHEAWERVRGLVSGEERLADDEFVVALAERLASGGDAAAGAPLFQVVVQRCDSCRGAAVVTEDGPMEIDAATADAVECGARRLRTDAAGDLILDEKTSPALRRRVLARDGNRCLLCGRSHGLTAHHAEERGLGGPTVASNLATLCAPCHGLVHEGLLRVEARGDGRFSFFDREGRPIEEAPSTGMRIEMAPGGGACAPGSVKNFEAVSLSRVPDRVDAAWWARHRHLFRWNDRRGGFDFREGTPLASSTSSPANAGVGNPVTLRDIIGAESAVRSLGIAVAASLATQQPVGHVLLTGPPGTGKTTLARALAGDLGTKPHVVLASLVRDPGVLVERLTSLERGDVLFIDEVHALPRAAAEVLYGAMDGFELFLPVSDGVTSRIVTLAVEPFTLVAATTEPHEMPEPLRSRFTHSIDLEPYDEEALSEITQGAARRVGLRMDESAATRIARASLETPRQAVNLVKLVHAAAIADERSDDVDAEFAARALAAAGYDSRGLGPTHRRVLAILEERGPARPIGLGALAARMSLPEEALRDTIEPPLLRLGLIERTPLGRVIAWREGVARKRLRLRCEGVHS